MTDRTGETVDASLSSYLKTSRPTSPQEREQKRINQTRENDVDKECVGGEERTRRQGTTSNDTAASNYPERERGKAHQAAQDNKTALNWEKNC